MFAAIYLYIGQLINKVDPFKMTSLQKLKGSIHNHATMKNQDDTFYLEAKSTSMKSRDKKKLAATFHQAGKNFQNFYVTIMCRNDELSWLFTNRLSATR